MANIGLKQMQKSKICFNCSKFGHGEIDYRRNDNKRKNKESGMANVATGSNYDLCEV